MGFAPEGMSIATDPMNSGPVAMGFALEGMPFARKRMRFVANRLDLGPIGIGLPEFLVGLAAGGKRLLPKPMGSGREGRTFLV